MTKRIFLLVLMAMFAAGSFAKEAGMVRSETSLMAAPYRDAKIIGQFKANARVDVLERRGAWLHVNVPDKDGWLRLVDVRLGEGPEKEGSSGFAALWNIGKTGRSGTQGIVATTGVRGMSADQLKEAEPNPKQFKKLQRFGVENDNAREYAQAGGLKEQKVAALPAPKSE